ncbi:MAG: hypothetical protein ACRD3W_11510 [Terriglobales bacterium]
MTDQSSRANDRAVTAEQHDDIWSQISSQLHAPMTAGKTKEGATSIVALTKQTQADFKALDGDHNGYVNEPEIEHYSNEALNGKASMQVARFLHDNYSAICSMHEDSIYAAEKDNHGITEQDLQYILDLKDPQKD